ncbi:MAG: S1C family serine protease [Acidimicrobiales bacterium]
MFETTGPNDDSGRRPPPPADDRLWRHPSELGAHAAASPSAPPVHATHTIRGHRYSLGTVVVASSLGALAMFGALAATGLLSGRDSTILAGTPSESVGADLTSTTTYVATSPDGVVALRLRTAGSTSYGVGMVVDRHGDIVTTLPVSGAGDLEATSVTVETTDESWTTVTRVGTDAITGLSVLRLDTGGDTTPARTGRPTLGQTVRMVRPGDSATAAAYGGDATTRVTSTNSSLTTGGPTQLGLAVLTSARPAGVTEVAVDTTDRSVVGLVVPADDNAEDEMSYAVPADLAARVGRQIALDGYAQHGTIDAQFEQSSPTTLDVAAVLPGSRSALAGLARGDEVLSVAGRAVHTSDDLAGTLLGLTDDDTVPVVVRRDRRMVTLRVPVTAAPHSTAFSTTTFP